MRDPGKRGREARGGWVISQTQFGVVAEITAMLAAPSLGKRPTLKNAKILNH